MVNYVLKFSEVSIFVLAGISIQIFGTSTYDEVLCNKYKLYSSSTPL